MDNNNYQPGNQGNNGQYNQPYNQLPGQQPNQQYCQSNQQFNQQYSQSNQQFNQQYGQSNQQYGQPNQQYNQQYNHQYSQPNPQYNQQYNQQYSQPYQPGPMQPDQPGKVQNPKNRTKMIVLICSIIGALLIVGAGLFVVFFMRMMKSDNAAIYGNTSGNKVVTRYFQALADRDIDQLEKCFVDGYDYNLEVDLFNADDAHDYEWDIDSLSVSENKSLSATKTSKNYNLNVQEAASYSVKCDYTHSVGTEKIPGSVEAELIAAKSSGRFYLLDVTDVTFEDETEVTGSVVEKDTEEDIEEETEETTTEEETTEEVTTEEETEEDTEEASSEEEIITTETVISNPNVKTYGDDEVGYLSVDLDLVETDEFQDSFKNASASKTYKNTDETFVVGIVRYDNATKTPDEMATELESTMLAQGDMSTDISDVTIGNYQNINAKRLSIIRTDGVYGNFFFFKQDGSLYLVQIVFAFQHVVQAETIIFTYEKPL